VLACQGLPQPKSTDQEKGKQMTTWLITGCSTGLGKSLAQAVLDAGFNAVVTARDVRSVQDLACAHPDTAAVTALDVTDKTQVEVAVKTGGSASDQWTCW
jgi:NADP-dependent 3-hydroxy acid dehydrogenase YdfG